MRRRNLIVGVGALTVGGAAAFGTEAFTSVEATRTVDVDVAKDANAYLALSPADSNNADNYVDTGSESSSNTNTIEIEFSDSDDTAGSGVNDEAVTKFDDLFKILNQGSQAANVYITDSSDLVTFRSDGSSIEGASNAVNLDVGEELIVSLTVDTETGTETDDDQLISTATIWGESGGPTSSGSVSSFDITVDPDDNSAYDAIQPAVDAAQTGDNIEIAESTYNEAVSIDTDELTLQSTGGIRNTVVEPSAQDDNNKAITVSGASNVTIDGLTVTFNGDPSDASEKIGLWAKLGSNDETPDNLTVRNSIFRDFSTSNNSGNSGTVRATGVQATPIPGRQSGSGSDTSNGTVDGVEVANCRFKNIRCTGDNSKDSKAKGVALNGDVADPRIADCDFYDIGISNENDPSTALEPQSDNEYAGTSKPRGISITEDGNGDGPTNFEVVRNDFDGIAGTYGQPSIFVGGVEDLGDSHKVESNNFRHPVDSGSVDFTGSGSGTKLNLTSNWWSEGDPTPPVKPSDEDEDGGVLIDRDGDNNDNTDDQSYDQSNVVGSKITNAGSTL
jgi:hypothetical protein